MTERKYSSNKEVSLENSVVMQPLRDLYLPVVAAAEAVAVVVVVEVVASAVVDLHLQIFRILLLPCST